MNVKPLLYFYLVALFIFLLGSGGYFLFTQRKGLLLKYTPNIYWKTQKETKDVDVPQVSGRVIRKAASDTLVIETVRGEINILIPPEIEILKLNLVGLKKEKEKIGFEEIKEGDYVLILPSYKNEKVAEYIVVSSYPIFLKVAKYETN